VGVLSRVIAAGGVNVAGRPQPSAPGGFGPTPVVTPLEDFYVIAKDLLPTRVDGATWRLSVGGLVERPREYTLDEVKAMPRAEGYRTLQCISNEVVRYGDLIGNQRWVGCRVRVVLDAAGIRSGATHVLWRSADGYTESLPIDVALEERTWLAYEMGPPGTPLAEEHGYPLRVLIAGRYGMKQPKWLTDIVVADHDEPGYWENRGWDRTAAVRVYSRIDDPRAGDHVPTGRLFAVSGVASAGDRGIARVEVSADGGTTWVDAELERGVEGTGDLTWVRWRAEIASTQAGSITLACRATDDAGNVQDGTPRPALPSGATGWHRTVVLAAPPA
jgi:DMSO/TMAO reductase YedYZ molybdopterin-dependent catalytic subunit